MYFYNQEIYITSTLSESQLQCSVYENVERIRATFGFQDSNIVYDKYNYMEEVFEQMFMEFRDYINELCNPLVQNVSHSTFIPRTNNNHSKISPTHKRDVELKRFNTHEVYLVTQKKPRDVNSTKGYKKI